MQSYIRVRHGSLPWAPFAYRLCDLQNSNCAVFWRQIRRNPAIPDVSTCSCYATTSSSAGGRFQIKNRTWRPVFHVIYVKYGQAVLQKVLFHFCWTCTSSFSGCTLQFDWYTTLCRPEGLSSSGPSWSPFGARLREAVQDPDGVRETTMVCHFFVCGF